MTLFNFRTKTKITKYQLFELINTKFLVIFYYIFIIQYLTAKNCFLFDERLHLVSPQAQHRRLIDLSDSFLKVAYVDKFLVNAEKLKDTLHFIGCFLTYSFTVVWDISLCVC